MIMVSSVQSSLSAIKAFGKKTNVSAHNVANMNTDNFKSSRATIVEDKQGGVKVQISKETIEKEPDDKKTVEKQPSDTDLAREFTQTTLSQRGYEANLKTVTTHDEMLGSVIDVIK